MRDARTRLQDILDAIDRIDRYAAAGRITFEHDELIQSWCMHHLLIIGEAAAKLGRDFHARHATVPWAQIVAMRNILVHDYFTIDTEAVWQTVERDLPMLRKAVADLLNQLTSTSPD